MLRTRFVMLALSKASERLKKYKILFIPGTLGSKVCKTPLKFLTVKLLWHTQILWKTETPGEKNLLDESTIVSVRSEVKQRSEHSQRIV